MRTPTAYYGRTVTRMHDSIQGGASYGCSIQHWQTAKERNWQRAQRVLYVVSVIGFLAALCFNGLGA